MVELNFKATYTAVSPSGLRQRNHNAPFGGSNPSTAIIIEYTR